MKSLLSVRTRYARNGAVLLLFTFALFLVRAQWEIARAARDQTHCQSNLRQIGVAMRMYMSDNDGAWPSRPVWENKLGLTEIEGCPGAGPLPTSGPPPAPGFRGYAYNYMIERRRELPFPAQTVAACDAASGISITHAPNPFGNGTVATTLEQGWKRHSGVVNYLFCDGQVRHLSEKEVGDGADDMEGNNGTHFTFATEYGTRHTALQR